MSSNPAAALALLSLGAGLLLMSPGSRWGRESDRPTRDGDSQTPNQAVALLLDLIAAALRSGLAVEAAIAAVTRCAELGGSAELTAAMRPLSKVGRLIGWGAEPEQAWRAAEHYRGYEAAAAAGRRCADSGARLAEALATAASNARAEHHRLAMVRANRVGVWALLPLGLCFLPAFVCLGIVPVIGGLGIRLLSAPSL